MNPDDEERIESVQPEATDEPESSVATPVTHQDLSAWRGRALTDTNGERIGALEDIYFDVDTDEPQFGTVKEGWLGRHLTFVPLAGAVVGPDSLQIPASIEQVKSAPNISDSSAQLTGDDESALYHHYQLNYEPSDRESKKRLVRH